MKFSLLSFENCLHFKSRTNKKLSKTENTFHFQLNNELTNSNKIYKKKKNENEKKQKKMETVNKRNRKTRSSIR